MNGETPLYAEYFDGETVQLGTLTYSGEEIGADGETVLRLAKESQRQFEFPRSGLLRNVYFMHDGKRVNINIPQPGTVYDVTADDQFDLIGQGEV